ncbi:MAG: Si-specific NAD(P)(+) transhydrogenase [Planctomycetes bacterium]|nr:Si-specific NAD(P)(+) transhydrogenase [Planctomycetota bacterium]
MSSSHTVSGFDVLVLGAGPAGHKAAVQAAKVGKRVLIVDREPAAGGECVQRGTIPSKTLRESAAYLVGLRARSEAMFDLALPERTQVAGLMRRLKAVRGAHERYLTAQLDRNGITRWHGRARFLTSQRVEVQLPDRTKRIATADVVIVATGSRPRKPDNVPVDHEHVLDSDSILSLVYLPASLTVLGSGVIASEFASIFAALGVRVTMVDSSPRPLSFLDPELGSRFTSAYERTGGVFLGQSRIESVEWDGREVVTHLTGGEVVRAEKCLCAQGRIANVAGLDIAAAGIQLTARGHVAVDENLRTAAPNVYAAGDVIGPPALAATAVEQGRRAARHALGLPIHAGSELVPSGIYTIPEIASVGLDEAQASKAHGRAFVGRARYEELARAHVNGETEGLLKLVAGPDGRVLGCQVVGEGATALVHVAQMAIVGGLTVEAFVDNVFNFPTLAEAFRVAALDVVARMGERQAA